MGTKHALADAAPGSDVRPAGQTEQDAAPAPE